MLLHIMTLPQNNQLTYFSNVQTPNTVAAKRKHAKLLFTTQLLRIIANQYKLFCNLESFSDFQNSYSPQSSSMDCNKLNANIPT